MLGNYKHMKCSSLQEVSNTAGSVLAQAASPVGICRKAGQRRTGLHLKAHMQALAQPPGILGGAGRACGSALPNQHIAVASGADQQQAARAGSKGSKGREWCGVALQHRAV